MSYLAVRNLALEYFDLGSLVMDLEFPSDCAPPVVASTQKRRPFLFGVMHTDETISSNYIQTDDVEQLSA